MPVIDGLPLEQLELIGATIHSALGDLEHFVYTNEGCHSNGPVGWKTIPPSLDIISIDGCEYNSSSVLCAPLRIVRPLPFMWVASTDHAGRNETDSMRAIYEAHLFPKLAPHQRVAVVPFLGGCACGTEVYCCSCHSWP